jgi:hypothetical protein
MFAPLPAGFPALESVVASLDAAAITPPPPIELIGQRLRKLYEKAGDTGYRSLSAGDMRKLPYAYFLRPEPSLAELRPVLVRRYWDDVLPDALAGGSRRARRWLMPLFFTYCEAFDARDPQFLKFAAALESRLQHAEGSTADQLREMATSFSFFQPAAAPRELARVIGSHTGSLDDAFRSLLLWESFTETPLGMAIFAAAIDAWQVQPSGRSLPRLLDWARRLAAPVCKTSLAGRFADALLTPWSRRQPPDEVRSMLLDFFLRVYDDPRIESNQRYQWRDVSPAAIAVFMNWLAGDTLKGFFRVLEKTADEIWRYRQKFWMAYYQRQYIEEAWLVLGWNAESLVRRTMKDQLGLGYGTLEGAQPDQSVLILRIGGLIFTEWSHNGSLRAYRADDPVAPDLYEKRYVAYELRMPLSMDFHDGMNQNPELRHMNSAGGTWQRKARDFIRKHTGVHLDDYMILDD